MAATLISVLWYVLFSQLTFFQCDTTAMALRHPSSILEAGYNTKVNEASELQIAPTCLELECPAYDSLHSGEGYEIRRYKASVWVSTAPIVDISFDSATLNGFLRLFHYINGSNMEHRKIPMTAPVLTGILPSSGPVCASSFIVRFFSSEVSSGEDTSVPVPKLNLKIEKWGSRCFAVRTFSGFASDNNVPQEAYSLLQSLKGTPWADISRTRGSSTVQNYIVAQYNSPFEVTGRVNEIWVSINTSKTDCQP